MGASLGLLSIASEREVFNHERILFLRIPSYLLSKWVALWVVSFLQTSFFLGGLLGFRWFRQAEMLYGWPTVCLILLVVGWTGLALGLLLSAVVNRRTHLAGFLLPLVIIFQMVFSVEVARQHQGGDSLTSAYANFPLRSCAVAPVCRRTAPNWIGQYDIWLCNRCNNNWGRVHSGDENGSAVSTAVALQELRKLAQPATSKTEDFSTDHAWWDSATAWISYGTFSRYADIALRSFAYNQYDYQARQQDAESTRGYRAWQLCAASVLAGFISLLLSLTAFTLWKQSGG
jgi:hypothetical protein